MDSLPFPSATPSPSPPPNCTNVAATAINTTAFANDEYFREASRFCIQRILVPIVVAVGVTGNSATIVVLTRRRMRSSTNVYLTALAVSDLLYLVAVFILSLAHYPRSDAIEYLAYWHARPFCLWLADSMAIMSVWLTVTFTVERYIAVCHPMRGRLLCTEQRAKRAVFIIALLSLLTTSTVPWEYQVDIVGNDVQCVRTQNSALGDHQTYRTVYYWFTAVVFTLAPLVLLAIFNCFLVSAVHRSQRQRSTMSQSVAAHRREENRITVTLIAVVILFMVCQTPQAVALVYSSFRPSKPTNIQLGLNNIFNFLVAVNASANFLLYCVLSDKYRRTFVHTFFPRCFPSPTAMARRSASMYSTHSDYTRARSNRVTNSVYLSVPLERNGRTVTTTTDIGDGDTETANGDGSGSADIVALQGNTDSNGKSLNKMI